MAIRNNLKGGTDWGEEGLKPTIDLNPTLNTFYTKAYGDIKRSTTATVETDLSSVTILSSDFDSDSTNVTLIITTGVTQIGVGSADSTTFRLYVNGVEVVSVPTKADTDGISGTGISWLATGIDLSSSNVIVKVTAESPAGDTKSSNGLTVLAIRNN